MRRTQQNSSTSAAAALLLQQQNHRRQQQHVGGGGGGSSDSYSSNSTYSDDSYSDTSDLANWEEHVAADGTLFYAEYMPQMKKATAATAGTTAAPTTTAAESRQQRVEFSRNSALRLGKKAAASASTATSRRQQQQQQQHAKQHKHQQKQKEQQQQQQHQQQKEEPSEPAHKFCHIKPSAPNSSKKLELVITAADRFRFGRRSTATESILGFRVAPYADKPDCLMLVDFVHDMPAMQQQQQHLCNSGGSQAPLPIQRGDWFCRLDDIDIRAANVEQLLLQFLEPTKVCLQFQGCASAAETQSAAGEEATAGGATAVALQQAVNFAQFAQVYEQLLLPPASPAATTTAGVVTTPLSPPPPPPPSKAVIAGQVAAASVSSPVMPFALLILPPECYQLDEHKHSLYYYPEDAASNFLYKTRGSFLTLNAVLSEELKMPPHTSRLLVDDAVPYYVNYRSLNSFLVLFGYAAACQSSAECTLRSDELIADMRFALPTLTLENFAIGSAGGGDTTTTALRAFLRHFCDVQRVRVLIAQRRQGVLFEELLPESRLLALPKEAQLRIFDALSEMEAMDYRNWNDEPLNTHREFFIYGSVLYYDHYLLTGQLPVEVRASVEGYMRCRGIFDFVAAHSVKALHVWKEIALPNASGRYFLTVCGRSHLLLAVILKIFDAPDLAADAVIAPSLFYIEEIQETLEHLIQCGIESLAMFWSIANKRPEVCQKFDTLLVDAPPAERDAGSRLETFIKQKLSGTSNATAAATLTRHHNNNNDEDAHLSSSLGGGSSVHSLTPSEEDGGGGGAGGGGQRKRQNAAGAEDTDSGSDWEHFGEQQLLQHGSSGQHDAHAQAQMTDALYKEINNVLPVNVTPGWKNSLFYYVYIDYANGTILCPLQASAETFPWLRQMRSAFHAIRAVLQRTRLARPCASGVPAEGSAGAAASLSAELTTIKEYATTIQVCEPSETGGAPVKAHFTVVGRLFRAPTKEVYICHHPDVPQNMLELAFRLSFFAAG